MNNFSKNPFIGSNNQAKIAGDYVIKKTDGGRVSLDSIRDKMDNLKGFSSNVTKEHSNVEKRTMNNQSDITRMRINALKNLGKK